MSESRLIYECMQLLGRYGAVFRCNAGQFYTKNGQPVSGLPRGFSDILFIRNDGLACFLELKAGRNKATPEQEAFLSKMQRLGARAGVARSAVEAAQICGLDIGGCD